MISLGSASKADNCTFSLPFPLRSGVVSVLSLMGNGFFRIGEFIWSGLFAKYVNEGVAF
jgi:hypothetical protein